MGRGTTLLIVCLLISLSVACAAEPERIIETVVHEATVQVEVTREVNVTVEVTRVVELTRLVVEEITVEVPVEVTRLVEKEVIVTATPEPTAIPTSLAAPAEAVTPAGVSPAGLEATLLISMQELAQDIASIERHYTLISFNRNVNCAEFTQNYDRALAAPEYNVPATSSEVQAA